MPDEHQHPHHEQHEQHGHGAPDADWGTIVQNIVIEGEVLLPVLHETLDRVVAVDHRPIARILDIGCGPGVATCALSVRFPNASVTGIDGSAAMLERARERAIDAGVGSRVEFRETNLDEPMVTDGDVDLIWASMVLHHIGDERSLLRKLAGRLAPGGLLAIAEFGDPLRYLPDGPDGLDGFQARCDAAGEEWVRTMRSQLPGATPSDDYPAMLFDAGFEVVDDRVVSARFESPLSEHGRKVILGQLRRRREMFADRAVGADRADGDLATLDELLDEAHPNGIMRRDDVFLELSRRVVIARIR